MQKSALFGAVGAAVAGPDELELWLPGFGARHCGRGSGVKVKDLGDDEMLIDDEKYRKDMED